MWSELLIENEKTILSFPLSSARIPENCPKNLELTFFGSNNQTGHLPFYPSASINPPIWFIYLLFSFQLWLTGTLLNASFRSTNTGEWAVTRFMCFRGRARESTQEWLYCNALKRVSIYMWRSWFVHWRSLSCPQLLLSPPEWREGLNSQPTRDRQHRIVKSVTTSGTIRELYTLVPKAIDPEAPASKQKPNKTYTQSIQSLLFLNKHENFHTRSFYLLEAIQEMNTDWLNPPGSKEAGKHMAQLPPETSGEWPACRTQGYLQQLWLSGHPHLCQEAVFLDMSSHHKLLLSLHGHCSDGNTPYYLKGVMQRLEGRLGGSVS